MEIQAERVKFLVREVQISMKNIQCIQGEEDVIELAAFGQYGSIGNANYVKYEELSEEGDSIQTVIKFAGQTVEVLKRGAICSKMIFTEGTWQQIQYETAYGVFEMMMHTTGVSVEETEERINIALSYYIYMDKELVSENKVSIDAVYK